MPKRLYAARCNPQGSDEAERQKAATPGGEYFIHCGMQRGANPLGHEVENPLDEGFGRLWFANEAC